MKIDGGKVKDYLLKTRKHQYELAAMLGVTEAFLSKVIRGRIKPSRLMIEQVHKILTRRGQ